MKGKTDFKLVISLVYASFMIINLSYEVSSRLVSSNGNRCMKCYRPVLTLISRPPCWRRCWSELVRSFLLITTPAGPEQTRVVARCTCCIRVLCELEPRLVYSRRRCYLLLQLLALVPDRMTQSSCSSSSETGSHMHYGSACIINSTVTIYIYEKLNVYTKE